MNSVSLWFTDLRRVALLTCVLSVFSSVQPAWNLYKTIVQTRPTPFWMLLTFLVALLLTATTPLFYFALYRNDVPLRFSKSLARLGLVGAIALGVLLAWDLARSWASVTREISNLVTTLINVLA